MCRRAGLLVLVFFAAGCAGDSAMWDAAKSDLRGDNSRMRSMQEFRGSELPSPTMSAERK